MLKDKFLEMCGNKYECLEDNKEDGVIVLSFGNEEEPLVLNFEIGKDKAVVNVINKDTHELVDDYDDELDSEGKIDELFDTAINTYESIKSLKSTNKLKIEETAIEVEEKPAQDEPTVEVIADVESTVDDCAQVEPQKPERSVTEVIDELICIISDKSDENEDEMTSKLLEDIALQLESIKLELNACLEE